MLYLAAGYSRVKCQGISPYYIAESSTTATDEEQDNETSSVLKVLSNSQVLAYFTGSEIISHELQYRYTAILWLFDSY